MTFTKVTDRLSYGGLDTCCRKAAHDRAIIHACKEPCHRAALGYAQKSLPRTHAAYLAHETPGHLYLNMIDPPLPLFQLDSFRRVLAFYDSLQPDQPLHIHCNQGRSRAPSLALLIMAKRLGLLPAESYRAARAAFPHPYAPGEGIAQFLTLNWTDIS
ncbi:hypothetical protein [Hyphomicrobium sp. MC8b]|uniref:hypothetical protein n=1 Tax=Hyphomicrobium sp. MC8b TaxID=300273 RepID=UPI00391D8727